MDRPKKYAVKNQSRYGREVRRQVQSEVGKARLATRVLFPSSVVRRIRAARGRRVTATGGVALLTDVSPVASGVEKRDVIGGACLSPSATTDSQVGLR